jgi:hypothetical protein
MTTEDFVVWRNIAIIPCIVAVLLFLAVVLCREWVKRDLRERACQPIKVRWRPSCSNGAACAFKVVYLDLQCQIHRADCQTFWHYRNVIWFGDEIIRDRHETVA